ncbi:permease for cytosine/purines, uracil, thiamine, allantoin-domain-containing protein [Phyllosticta citrichinensis]
MADIEAKPHGNVSVADLREETTWGRLIKRIQLQPQPGIEGKWTNADLDLTPPEQRNWTTWNYVFYWTNDATAPGNLRLGSSLWSMGLSWKLVLLTIALGHAIMTVALTFNAEHPSAFTFPLPWNILSSAEALLNFMDGYTIWLAPITGVLLADFWLIHDRHYDVHELYLPTGRYRYNRWETNWRAAVAWTIGWVPLVPGLAAATSSSSMSSVAKHIYSLGYLYGILTSFVVYVVLSRVWKP